MNNDNDLIRRGDALKIIDGKSEFWALMGFADTVDGLMAEVNAIPAVEQPMSAVEYERITRRFSDWCADQLCSECDFLIDCPYKIITETERETTPEQRVESMQKWAQEHPERGKE